MQESPTTTTTPPGQAPGPRGIPILGNALQVTGKDGLQKYINLWREYGDVVFLKLGPLNGYLLVNPEHIHHILVKNQKNYIKGIGYDGFRLLVGQGLVTSEGELWQQQRRLMQPSFTPSATTRFADMMIEVTHDLLERWRPAADQGRPLTMDTEMTRLTMSIIGRAMFGVDLSAELTQVGQAFQSVFAFIPDRSFHPLKLPLSVPLPSHRRFQDDMQIINHFIDTRIQEQRQRQSEDTLLALLMHARDEDTGQHMDLQQLRDEVITLFFAGFETTARSLTWGWYLLTEHPEVARKLEAEIDQVLGGRAPTLADLFNLQYTRMVVDETLRLYPPTALLARQNLEDDQIGGYHIPAQSMIVLIPYMVHRYPGIWPDPERFDPERFAPDAVGKRPKYAYIPFASGPRVCLGNNFALLEMVLAFAMVAARYRIERVSQEKIGHEFVGVTRPTRRLEVRISHR